MQHRLFLIVSIALLSFNCHAQPTGQFGFKGGLNVSSLGNKEAGLSAKLGYNFGFYGEKRFYQEVGVQTELLVSFQGARSTDVSEVRLNYTYIVLPIIANIYFSEGAAVELGLQGGYLIRAIQKDGGNKINIRDSVNNWDLSGIIGLAYGKKFGRIGIRYVLGITNTNGSWFTFDTNSKNKVLQLYLAVPLVTYE